MTQQLRDELERIAADAPIVDIPADTWARGRRTHRRDVAVRVGVVAVALAVLGSVLSFGVGQLRPIQPADPTPADVAPVLPGQIWAVPDHLRDSREDGEQWTQGVGEGNLRIGAASLAFVDSSGGASGLPVVVTRDGAYHPLDLPGYVGEVFGANVGSATLTDTLALSPDGTHLAWVYGRPSPGREDYSPVASGVRVVDLTTGEVSETNLLRRVTEGQAVVPYLLSFSPDGRWLAWQGKEMRQWNGSGSGTGGLPRQAGRIEVATGVNQAQPQAGRRDGVGVLSDGTVLFRQGGRLGLVGPTAAGSRGTIVTAEAAAVPSPAGTRLALDNAGVEAGSATLMDVRSGRLTPRQLSTDVYRDPVALRPLGWVDEQHLLAVVTTTDDATYDSGSHLAIMTGPQVPRDRATYRVLTRIESGVDVSTLSVAATGLDLDDPTADLPEPDWPWSIQRKAVVGGLVGAGLLGLGLLAALAWRRTGRSSAQ